MFDTVHERNACVQSENEMERKFAEYLADFTSEWIPCNDDDGNLMVFLDQEVGVHDSNAWLKTFSWAASSILRMIPGELRGLDRQAFDNGVTSRVPGYQTSGLCVRSIVEHLASHPPQQTVSFFSEVGSEFQRASDMPAAFYEAPVAVAPVSLPCASQVISPPDSVVSIVRSFFLCC